MHSKFGLGDRVYLQSALYGGNVSGNVIDIIEYADYEEYVIEDDYGAEYSALEDELILTSEYDGFDEREDI